MLSRIALSFPSVSVTSSARRSTIPAFMLSPPSQEPTMSLPGTGAGAPTTGGAAGASAASPLAHDVKASSAPHHARPIAERVFGFQYFIAPPYQMISPLTPARCAARAAQPARGADSRRA